MSELNNQNSWIRLATVLAMMLSMSIGFNVESVLSSESYQSDRKAIWDDLKQNSADIANLTVVVASQQIQITQQTEQVRELRDLMKNKGR